MTVTALIRLLQTVENRDLQVCLTEYEYDAGYWETIKQHLTEVHELHIIGKIVVLS